MATLKISDLSVGDWVYYGNETTPYSIRSVYRKGIQDCVVLNDEKFSDGVIAFVDRLTPIPITAEVLEKNGWASDEICAEMRITEYSHLEYDFREHRLRKWGCRETGWLPGEIVTSITFTAHCYNVHDLQHALRIAGVDKKINL